MCSRDGKNFHRYPQAYLTPGVETETNWLYGDCFASWPLTETGDTYSFYMVKNVMAVAPKHLYRYELRKDCFACYEAERAVGAFYEGNAFQESVPDPTEFVPSAEYLTRYTETGEYSPLFPDNSGDTE